MITNCFIEFGSRAFGPKRPAWRKPWAFITFLWAVQCAQYVCGDSYWLNVREGGRFVISVMENGLSGNKGDVFVASSVDSVKNQPQSWEVKLNDVVWVKFDSGKVLEARTLTTGFSKSPAEKFYFAGKPVSAADFVSQLEEQIEIGKRGEGLQRKRQLKSRKGSAPPVYISDP